MKGWKCIRSSLKCFACVVLGFFVFVFMIIMATHEPVNMGMICGVILAAGLAFAITMSCLVSSNDVGSKEGQFKDFTEEPMQFLK